MPDVVLIIRSIQFHRGLRKVNDNLRNRTERLFRHKLLCNSNLVVTCRRLTRKQCCWSFHFEIKSWTSLIWIIRLWRCTWTHINIRCPCKRNQQGDNKALFLYIDDGNQGLWFRWVTRRESMSLWHLKDNRVPTVSALSSDAPRWGQRSIWRGSRRRSSKRRGSDVRRGWRFRCVCSVDIGNRIYIFICSGSFGRVLAATQHSATVTIFVRSSARGCSIVVVYELLLVTNRTRLPPFSAYKSW